MDIRFLHAALYTPPPPRPESSTQTSPRGVTGARETFAQERGLKDREADEPPAHGPQTLTPTLFFSLLSLDTQSAMRGFLYGGFSPANEERGGAGEAPTSPPVTGAATAPAGDAVINGAEAPVGPAMAMAGGGGLRRAAMAAYAQSLMASPGFSYARPAESLNLMA